MMIKVLWFLITAAGLVAAGSSSVSVSLIALAVLAGLVGITCWSIGAAQLAIVQLLIELVVVYYLAKETKTSVTRNGWSLFALLALILLAVAAGRYLRPALSVLAGAAPMSEGAFDWASLIGGFIVVLTALAGAATILQGYKREGRS